jgi:DNA primase
MALFPQSFLDDLKAQTNIVSLIGDVVPLKKAGATWKGLCPFHQERTPSFNVNGEKGFFKCFGCGAGGDAVKFVELYQKVSFPEAIRYLAQRAGMPVPETQGGPDERAARRFGRPDQAARGRRGVLQGTTGLAGRRAGPAGTRVAGLTAETSGRSVMGMHRRPVAIHCEPCLRTGRSLFPCRSRAGSSSSASRACWSTGSGIA